MLLVTLAVYRLNRKIIERPLELRIFSKSIFQIGRQSTNNFKNVFEKYFASNEASVCECNDKVHMWTLTKTKNFFGRYGGVRSLLLS